MPASRPRSEVCRFSLVSIVAAALVFGGAAAAMPPRHIMSMNMCTDELLLDLVPAERIASVTYLSRQPSNSYLWPAAAHVPINHGLTEEVLAEDPDLVLAGTYTTPPARLLLKKIGVPLMEILPANSFAEIRDVTRMVARAVGEPARRRVATHALAFNRKNRPLPKVHRIWSSHPCQPPSPASTLNPTRDPLGIPFDSA
jgi:ABC-type hemin transport system substrate-binding protein